jgi:hypothetical protein
MMTQFRGREEELVETLRSMQERQVAQKARLESQKQAKRDAKAYVENKSQQDSKWMSELEGSDVTPAGRKRASEGDTQPSSRATTDDTLNLTTVPDDEEKEKAMKAQLKEAIENEDWQNVAAISAGLSSHGIFQDNDEGDFLDTASTASGRSLEINNLVDKGDWDAVVAAATRYVEADSRKTDESTIEERRKKRENRLKEEEDALAQAEIWDAIAEQTRVESQAEEDRASNTGANLAAAWAIDRSLTALQKAETEKDQDDPSDKKKDVDGEV